MAVTRATRTLTKPTPGFYLLRIVPRGWQVPASIRRVGDLITGDVDGEPLGKLWSEQMIEEEAAEAIVNGALFDHPLLRISLFGETCSETKYHHRAAIKVWAKEHAPWHPCLSPRRPIDPALLPAEDF